MLSIIFMYSIYYYTSVNFCKKILLFFTMRRESQCMVEKHCTFFSHDFSLHSKTNILIVRAAQSGNKMDKEKKWNKEKEKTEMWFGYLRETFQT